MNQFIEIGGVLLELQLAQGISLTILFTIIMLVYFYLKTNESKISLDEILYNSDNLDSRKTKNTSSSIIPILDSANTNVLDLSFCKKSCTVLDKTTGKIVGRFKKGSLNCRLMCYLFESPNTFISELDIVEKTNPDNPTNFYLSKAIYNLRIEKSIKEKMFTIENGSVRLNSQISINI